MAKGCETHSRPHSSFDWFGNRKALAVTFNPIKWPALSGALQHEFIALLVFDAEHTGEGLCAIRSRPGEKGPLTPHAPFLSSEDGVYLRKGEPLGRYIYKEFRGCVVILLRWLGVREAIPRQNADLGQDTRQWQAAMELRCGQLCTVSCGFPCWGLWCVFVINSSQSVVNCFQVLKWLNDLIFHFKPCSTQERRLTLLGFSDFLCALSSQVGFKRWGSVIEIFLINVNK